MVRQSEARNGFTLTEVLMALFVMAIGMISLLALFPAGYIQARWALDNEQVARGAANAQSMTEVPHTGVVYPFVNPNPIPLLNPTPLVFSTPTSIRNDDYYAPNSGNGNSCWLMCANAVPGTLSSRINQNTFLKLPSALGGTWTYNTSIINAPRPVNSSTGAPILTSSRVKYPPVFVDPFIGDSFIDNGTFPPPFPPPPQVTNLPFHVGANVPSRVPFRFASSEVAGGSAFRPDWSLGIPRFSLSQFKRDSGLANPDFVTPVKLRKQIESSLSDEVDFGINGQPNTANNFSGTPSGQYASQRRFTWGYMCQWYDYATPEVCDISLVVFNSRPTTSGMPMLPMGETNYGGSPLVSAAAGVDTAGFGRIFVKGLNQAVIQLPLPYTEPMKAKAGDWILDNTLILPEFNTAFPGEVAPFLDEYSSLATCVVSTTPVRTLRPGLAGGHFYKILDISSVQQVGGLYYQTITLDRPAKSDGFSACMIAGIADVITKGVGKMPQR